MRRIQFRAVLLAAALIAAPAVAQPPHHRPPDFEIKQHAERLGLDDETLAAVEAAVARAHEGKGAMHQRMMEARRGLRELLEQPMPEPSAVMSQADQVNAVQNEMTKHRLATTLEIRALLSESQRAELVKVMAERSEEHQARRARHHEMIGAACGPDIERFCPNEEPGPGRGMCLHRQDDALSPACSAAMSTRGPDGPRGR